MGVYIKGMEMPTHCMDCPFMVSRDNDDCILQSDEANENFETWEQMKAGCPLVTVPPHGRLIESKAFLKVAHETDDFSLDELAHLAVLVAATPTIIPAEEGE